jgi:hypothetical protein
MFSQLIETGSQRLSVSTRLGGLCHRSLFCLASSTRAAGIKTSHLAGSSLRVSEVLHGIAVVLGEQVCLDRDRLLGGVDDLREICPGLIDFGLEVEENIDSTIGSTTDTTRPEVTVRIAHFLV